MAERKIKHGLFTYYSPEPYIDQGGQESTRLVEQMAFHDQTVDIPREADIARGEEFGAFYTEEELKAEASANSPAPEEAEEVELSDLDDEDLVDWLMATGAFDGEKKPNAQEVLDAVGNDPELAQRVLTAEGTATGGDPRKKVTEGLGKVVEPDTE